MELQTPERAYSREGRVGGWGKSLRGGYRAESVRSESVYSQAHGGPARDPRELAEEYQRALRS